MFYTLSNINFDASQIGESGVTIAIVGWLVVFSALILLYVVFNTIPKIMKLHIRRKLREKGQHECAEKREISSEESAAISMALYLYFNELHDEESNVLTIKKISRIYSPWSSKIWSVRNSFNRP